MEREPSVQIREPCGGCDGTAKRKVQSGAGHVSWAKTVACPDCDGSGHVSRWIPLSEFKALLERQPGG